MVMYCQLHTLASLPVGKDASTDWTEDCVGHRVGMDSFGEEKISSFASTQTLDCPSLGSRCTD